jgi:REP element-mobilizing transposase RayT
MDTPLAYFITFTCRGAWLHGDERGSVDMRHNTYGTPFLQSDPDLQEREAELVEPYLLDEPRRKIALNAIIEIASKKTWHLWAVHVRSNHVHVIVTALTPVERIMNDIKTAISRRLNKAFPNEANVIRWTRHGSTRYVWTETVLDEKICYVVEGQGSSMAVFDGRDNNPSRARSAAE